MKIRKFDSYDEYETFYENAEIDERYEVVDIVRSENGVCADLMTEAKSAKTALNRFFRTVKNHKMFADWEETIKDCIENGCYRDDEYKDCGFVWEVENYDESWYIMIKISNEYIEAVA